MNATIVDRAPKAPPRGHVFFTTSDTQSPVFKGTAERQVREGASVPAPTFPITYNGEAGVPR